MNDTFNVTLFCSSVICHFFLPGKRNEYEKAKQKRVWYKTCYLIGFSQFLIFPKMFYLSGSVYITIMV